MRQSGRWRLVPLAALAALVMLCFAGSASASALDPKLDLLQSPPAAAKSDVPPELAATAVRALAATPATEARLNASDGTPNSEFGASVSLSADGRIALVGARRKNSFTGKAYVFVKSGATWTQAAQLQSPTPAPGDLFGLAVSLSADGRTAVVTAPGENAQRGAAYVFYGPSSNPWSQVRRIVAADGAAADLFGYSASFDATGTVALVGAPGDDAQRGAAYVFYGPDQAQQRKLVAANGAPSHLLGYSAGVSALGRVAVVGAPGKDAQKGSAYVFDSGPDRSYGQQQELQIAGGLPSHLFGFSVATTPVGNVVLVGAPNEDGTRGAAYIFVERYGDHVQQQRIQKVGGVPSDLFGTATSLNAIGNVALVAAGGEASSTGAAYRFRYEAGSYVQQDRLAASDGVPGDQFGFYNNAVLGATGTVALIGALGKDAATGTAYVFGG